MLPYVTEPGATWSKQLLWVEYAHNTLPGSASGLSPFQCAYGYRPPRFHLWSLKSQSPLLRHWCHNDAATGPGPTRFFTRRPITREQWTGNKFRPGSYMLACMHEHVHDIFKHGNNSPTLWPLVKHHHATY